MLKHKIEGYFRHVDNIRIMYKEDKTDIQDILDKCNNLMPKLKITLEKEEENKINFLDVTITKDHDNLTSDIGNQQPLTSSY